MGRARFLSDCRDQSEDGEDNQKKVEREGRHCSKNLVAERKRRKKLNDRLYTLRSIVPKITKMDRASILGDAIEYVKELQHQVKDLQNELEDTPDIRRNNLIQPEDQKRVYRPEKYEQSSNALRMGDQETGLLSSSAKITGVLGANRKCGSADDSRQQMEAQVEVSRVGEQELGLKILCENRADGFSRLMQAVDSLGLEVITVNVATIRGLVLYLLEVVRDDEGLDVEQVRDSLLQLT
ncbi:transcription factor ABORTED MICROSPORES-like [Nymphaea colorata]|nr:transcription factor ABORTED MICROSPORES-like [Nymphaea colorata]XP_049935621.1 transcription factor ABORTED MICROSPORES-like [Nymphaea colorata]